MENSALGAESMRQTLTAFDDCIDCGLYGCSYIILIFSVHCRSGELKICLGGTIGDNVHGIYFFRYFVFLS